MSKHLKKANWDTLDTITPKYKNVRPNDRSIMKQNFIDTVHDIADRHVKGKPFDNTDGILPPHNNYYRFNVPTPGMSKAGEARLVISDSGKIYATTDHYKSFVEILGG